MARTVATLPAGSRITDYISLGVIAKFIPLEKVHEALHQTKRASRRERDLPAHVVVYYVIALAPYMRSSYREVLRSTAQYYYVKLLTSPQGGGKLRCMTESEIEKCRKRLEQFLADLLEPLGRRERRHWGSVYVRGLLLDGERKSIEPMAARCPRATCRRCSS